MTALAGEATSTLRHRKEPVMRPEDAHVLVIEDDPNNQRVIKDLLHLAGIRYVTVATAGWQGLRAARTQMPRVDLILLDIQLPAEDGYGVLSRIRESPRFRTTKVVAVTANVSSRDEAKARAAGFDGFIGKPLDFDRFPVQIHAVLQGAPIWAPH